MYLQFLLASKGPGATKCLPESVYIDHVFSDILGSWVVTCYSANHCKSNHLNSGKILILFPLGLNQNLKTVCPLFISSTEYCC